jgi:hypothetical protein
MENPTSFDLNEAIRRWRTEFGSPGSLSAVDMEELESHLRDHVAALAASGMKPEAAFSAAVKQLGDRQRVAAEFAKINPQRIWLERAIWMAAGVLLCFQLSRLAAVAGNIILNYGFRAQWDPFLYWAAISLCELGSVATLGAFCWFCFARRPAWGGWLARVCERRPLLAGMAMALALWGSDRFSYYHIYILEHFLPRLHAWLFPVVNVMPPNAAVINRIMIFCGIAEDVICAAALCWLAARVVRQSLLPAGGAQGTAANSPWLNRLMWMMAGCVLVRFGVRNLYECLVLLPVLWLLPVLGPSAVLQHLVGLTTAALHMALWATPFWACWIFITRCPPFAGWMLRAFQYRPFWTSVGVTLLLNASGVLGLLLLWTGIHVKTPGSGFGPIISQWNWGPWMGIWQHVAPAVLLLALVRWRMKLREA